MQRDSKMHCVVTRLNGGLGNQMFQYAAGYSLAKRLNVPLKIDISEFETYHLRRFELDQLNITAGVATPEELAYFITHPTRFQRKLSRLSLTLGLGFNKIAFKEIKFSFDDAFDKIQSPAYLNGYWQSEKYFKTVRDSLRGEFCPVAQPGEVSRNILDEVQQSNAISLHIRRGDYISNPAAASVHGVCPLEYYYSAISYLSAQVQNPVFFVFSDDPQWAQDNLKISHPVRFVIANGPDRGIEDMLLMQSCHHHIIANSSFSWWAAWLNNRQDKIVIAPRIWLLDSKKDTRDLIPEQWHRI